MPHFDAVKTYCCGKHCEKRRTCLKQALSPFLTMFSTPYETYFSFSMHFKMLAVICLQQDRKAIMLTRYLVFVYIELKFKSLPLILF